jgi:hypothetical protein
MVDLEPLQISTIRFDASTRTPSHVNCCGAEGVEPQSRQRYWSAHAGIEWDRRRLGDAPIDSRDRIPSTNVR